MDDSFLLKIVGVILIINAIYASFTHQKGKVTIYVDWTDAAITALSPLIGFATFYLCIAIFHMADGKAQTASIGVFAVLLFFGLRFSWNANNSVGAFLSAAAAKYTMLMLVYVAVAATLSGGRRNHERETTTVKRNAAIIDAIAASYAAWSAWVSRAPRFTPVANWFAGDSFKLLNPNDPLSVEQLQPE